MCSRVLRTDVDHIFFFPEKSGFFVFNCSVRVQLDFLSCIERLLIGHAERVVFFWIIVFAHRMTYPVIAQVKTAHIGMTYKGDTIVIENFPFIEVGYFPYIADRRDFRLFAVCCRSFQCYPFARNGRFQMIDYA